jgi:hypothetical protein
MPTEEDGRVKVPFAPEWFSVMAEIGFMGLRDWLEQSKAPREAIDLLDDVVLLAQYQGELNVTGNLLSQESIDNLAQILLRMTESAARLGVTFQGPASNSSAREPLAWRALDASNGSGPLALWKNKNRN